MIFKIKSYFHFLTHSTNQHGVHSPFVFQLVTKCFYKKNNTSNLPKLLEINTSKKQKTLLKKLYRYFLPTHWKVASFLEEQKQVKYDFIIFENPNKKLFQKEFLSSHNDTVFVFKNIYKNSEYFQTWKSIIRSEKVTVSVNTYYLGIVFVRKEQAKQNFFIRV